LQVLTDREARRQRRPLVTERDTKSISAETTFDTDLGRAADLERHLWRLAEKLARRLKSEDYASGGVVLKLKTAAFATRTRAGRLANPTRLPDTLFAAARALLSREVDGTRYRLIGIGAAPLLPGDAADQPDLADPDAPRRNATQQAIDSLRGRFGVAVIGRGRGLTGAARR
jgi:DNA polymerase-4